MDGWESRGGGRRTMTDGEVGKNLSCVRRFSERVGGGLGQRRDAISRG